MTERLSAEQLAEIRNLLDRRNYTMGLAARDAMEKLVAELDAVTRERDLAETANTRLHIVAEGLGRGIDDARSIIAELTRERDALSSRLDDFISARATGRSANDD